MLDKALLVVIEVLATTVLQSEQVVSRLVAEEVPVPMEDHTNGPTITLIAPPYTCNRRSMFVDAKDLPKYELTFEPEARTAEPEEPRRVSEADLN